MAKTSLSTEPEWEDPVQLSCDTGDQVQTHFQRIDMLISGPGHFWVVPAEPKVRQKHNQGKL